MTNELDWKVYAVIFVVAIGAMVLLARRDTCRPDQLGQVQLSRARGDRIERCDGECWRPFTMPEVAP